MHHKIENFYDDGIIIILYIRLNFDILHFYNLNICFCKQISLLMTVVSSLIVNNIKLLNTIWFHKKQIIT